MSFERLNGILKEISASNSYESISNHLENDFSTTDEEKIIRISLKKLSDWFRQNPTEIFQLKKKFSEYFLRKSIRLKQKDLIDFLVEQLKNRFDDFLLYLLVELFQKNFPILFNELEKENDVDYLLHLSDRLANVSMRNLPVCFQRRHFFLRLSQHIENELVHRHFPNVVAGKDTNLKFLSQLIHKTSKFGATEFVWRPLVKNFFVKRCPREPICCRFIEFILCEPIDDLLLQTIRFVDGHFLDLILSDRILHQNDFEVYFTDTLLFRKTLPIEQIRTILIYLSSSTNRLKKCFFPVFHRYLSLWSDERFIRFSSPDQHFLICQSISICLSIERQSKIRFQPEDFLLMKILNGIRFHFESTFESIRCRAQILAELIFNQLKFEFSSSSNQLEFHGYDPENSEVKLLKKLAQTPIDVDEENFFDDEEKIEEKSTKETLILTNKTLTLRQAAENDNDDDDDEEFPMYDCSEDKLKTNVRPPSYIRSCLADLIATDKVEQLESALRVLPTLVRLYKIQCEEIALELVRILLNYNNTFEIEDFHQLQLNGLVELTSSFPLMISEYLTKEFYERNYTIQQRSLILKTINETAKRLTQIDEIHQNIENKDEDEDEEEEEEENPFQSIINQRLKLKTIYKKRRKTKKNEIFKENRFGEVVGHFFYPLINRIDEKSRHLTLIDGDEDHLLLCELLACLGRLCIQAQNTSRLVNLLQTFLPMLKSLRKHADAGVRHAVVYSYACSIVSLNGFCSDEQIQSDFIELKQWLDEIIQRDNNSEVQKLGRAVRQILLKTLQEINNN